MDASEASSNASLERRFETLEARTDEKLEGIRGAVYETREIVIKTSGMVDGILRDLSKGYAQFEKQGAILDDHTRRIEEIQGTLNGRHGQPGIVQQVDELKASSQTKSAEQRGATRVHSKTNAIAKFVLNAVMSAVVAAAAAWGVLTAHAR
ncbi:hypothetical protein MHY1_01019 [Methylovirgula sp. HY1]|nr:hypothetical protein MHY1_01019 [Methylovirgula sp. HY1]